MNSKSKRNVLINKIWLVVLILLSIYLISVIVKENIVKNTINTEANFSNKEETIKIDEIDTVEILCYYETINIEFSDSVESLEMKIDEKSAKKLKQNHIYVAETNGSKLSLVGTKDSDDLTNNTVDLNVILPNSFKGTLLLTTSSGDIIITGDCNCDIINVSQEYGNIQLMGNVTASKCEINNTMGNSYLKSLVCKDFHLLSEIGNWEIDNLSGAGNVKSDNGTIKVLYSEITGASTIEGNMSDIEVNLVDTFNGIIQMDSSSGEVKSNLKLEMDQGIDTIKQLATGEGNNNLLQIKNTMGDIVVNMQK